MSNQASVRPSFEETYPDKGVTPIGKTKKQIEADPKTLVSEFTHQTEVFVASDISDMDSAVKMNIGKVSSDAVFAGNTAKMVPVYAGRLISPEGKTREQIEADGGRLVSKFTHQTEVLFAENPRDVDSTVKVNIGQVPLDAVLIRYRINDIPTYCANDR